MHDDGQLVITTAHPGTFVPCERQIFIPYAACKVLRFRVSRDNNFRKDRTHTDKSSGTHLHKSINTLAIIDPLSFEKSDEIRIFQFACMQI